MMRSAIQFIITFGLLLFPAAVFAQESTSPSPTATVTATPTTPTSTPPPSASPETTALLNPTPDEEAASGLSEAVEEASPTPTPFPSPSSTPPLFDPIAGEFIFYEEPPSPEEIFLSLYQNHIGDWLSGSHAWWQDRPHNVRKRLIHAVCRFVFRSLDGGNTNSFHPDWGKAGTAFARYLSPDYGDGVSFPAGSGRASAREVSNMLSQPENTGPNPLRLTDFFWLWGQFVSHDLYYTEPASDEYTQFKIRVPMGDPVFDSEATGTEWLSYSRTKSKTGSDPQAQLNLTTAYLDASQIYSAEEYRSTALRSFVDGKLKITESDAMLPYNRTGLPNVGGDSEYLYLSGDVRANEHIGITALHTLFFREHNRLADEIRTISPRLSDEEVFSFARELVAAEIQQITYNEFLPLLLGQPFPEYRNFDPELDPTIRNLFATAAFELWYSMMPAEILLADDDRYPVYGSPYPLREVFFAPWLLWYKTDLDYVLKGFSLQPARTIDPYVDDALRNFTFEESGIQAVDFVSVLIQRGRDHGLPSYNTIRMHFGLEPLTDFSEISSNIELNERLRLIYQNVDNIDAWIGLSAEEKAFNAPIGETLKRIITDQFLRIRDGDRFWHERSLRPQFAELVQDVTLADVIRNNTELTDLSENLFQFSPPQIEADIGVEPVF